MPERSLEARCLCGEVRFTVAPPLGAASYCHCTRCQRRTGSGASAQVRVEAGAVLIQSGAELVRSWQPPDGFAKDFCADCGAHLWSRNSETGEIASIRMAAFEDDPGVRPSYRQFVDDAAPWEPIPDDGLDRFAGSAWSSGGTGTIKP
jgi:hypothetical protein